MAQLVTIGSKGIAVCFHKDELLSILRGATINGELVNGDGKVKLLFMRDRTFKEIQVKHSKQLRKAAAVADSVVVDINEAKNIAEDL